MLMVVTVNVTVYWNVMPCSLVDKVPSFQGNHPPLRSFMMTRAAGYSYTSVFYLYWTVHHLDS